ncbi:MAG: hypothetical protein M0035_06215, partial [Actinomycetota bacterium]|nr:hypothetical protein [Actinomycetota bacterium]
MLDAIPADAALHLLRAERLEGERPGLQDDRASQVSRHEARARRSAPERARSIEQPPFGALASCVTPTSARARRTAGRLAGAPGGPGKPVVEVKSERWQ